MIQNAKKRLDCCDDQLSPFLHSALVGTMTWGLTGPMPIVCTTPLCIARVRIMPKTTMMRAAGMRALSFALCDDDSL